MQYSIPQVVVDEHMKILLLHIYLLGMLELGVIVAIGWILSIMRHSSARIRSIKPGTEEREGNNSNEELRS